MAGFSKVMSTDEEPLIAWRTLQVVKARQHQMEKLSAFSGEVHSSWVIR